MKSRKKTHLKIVGSKGDSQPPPPAQHIPVDSPDSLQSKAYARFVDLISEGEIEGLVDGGKSIFLDKTPLQNSDGSYNFSGVSYEERSGSQDQSYMAGFADVENEIQVGVEVEWDENNDGVVRQITNTNVNRVRIKLGFPQFQSTNQSSGDVSGTLVSLSILVQPDEGSYTLAAAVRVEGKSSSQYQRTVEIELTGDGPWNIKVRRDTHNATTQYVQDKSYWQSYTEVIDAKLRYPNSALIGIRFDAQQFQQIPSRFYDLKLLKIKIPSNATVRDDGSLTYSGSWDGTFQTAWSNNPAWVFYDLISNERYGLGTFVSEDQVDKWALYEIGTYCDELVEDGEGGTEPRFSCNLMLADRGEAYTVLQSLASVFRGMIYWSAGAVTASQDSPQDAAYLFTAANVLEGRFTYQGASAKARHSVALIRWNDPDNFYEQSVEYVEDQDAIARFGIQTIEVVAFGCTSRSQAHRVGKWILYTEQNESETVTFKTGIEGVIARPGQVVKISDPNRAGARLGGRISEATVGSVTVDQEITGSISGNTLSVILPDSTIEDRTVIGNSGRVISVQPDFSVAPSPQSIWILKNADVEPQTFRVISVQEEEGGTFIITALKHDPDKFDSVENDINLPERSYSYLTALTDSPKNVVISETLYQTASEVKAKIIVSWDKVDRATSYIVRYKKDNDNFIELKETSVNEQDILDTQPGFYTIQVCAVNSLGRRSAATQIEKEAYGKLAPPADVTGFSMIPNVDQAYISWDKATDLDVLIGGQVRIRHTPRTSSQSWNDAVDVIPAVPGTATSAVAPLLDGTYMAKFLDSSGNYSESEAIILTTVPYANALNVVESIQEDPAFPGNKTHMIYDAVSSAIILGSGELVDDYDYVDTIGNWDLFGEIFSEGTYEFNNTVDLGGVWPSNIKSVIDLEAFDIGNLIDSRLELIDTWSDIDSSIVNDVNAELQVRTTEDDPSGSPTWTDWKRIRTGAYTARGFQFKLICTTESTAHDLYIKQLRVTIDVNDRVEHFGPLSSGTGMSYRVDYGFPFFADPAIGITANNMTSGDYYTITNVDETGFDIVFKNSGGTIVNRTFNVIAKGYGRKVG